MTKEFKNKLLKADIPADFFCLILEELDNEFYAGVKYGLSTNECECKYECIFNK